MHAVRTIGWREKAIALQKEIDALEVKQTKMFFIWSIAGTTTGIWLGYLIWA